MRPGRTLVGRDAAERFVGRCGRRGCFGFLGGGEGGGPAAIAALCCAASVGHAREPPAHLRVVTGGWMEIPASEA